MVTKNETFQVSVSRRRGLCYSQSVSVAANICRCKAHVPSYKSALLRWLLCFCSCRVWGSLAAAKSTLRRQNLPPTFAPWYNRNCWRVKNQVLLLQRQHSQMLKDEVWGFNALSQYETHSVYDQIHISDSSCTILASIEYAPTDKSDIYHLNLSDAIIVLR